MPIYADIEHTAQAYRLREGQKLTLKISAFVWHQSVSSSLISNNMSKFDLGLLFNANNLGGLWKKREVSCTDFCLSVVEAHIHRFPVKWT